MTHLKMLFDGIDWWTLAPASADGPVQAEAGRLTTAVAGDRSWSISYLVDSGAVTVDRSAFASDTLSIRWYDPSAGIMSAGVEMQPAQGGAISIAPPAVSNRAGFGDWVLLVSAGR